MPDSLRIGFLVNPLAGMGGRLATHGSDHLGGLAEALALGGVPQVEERAARSLHRLRRDTPDFRLLTAKGIMGGRVSDACGLDADIVYESPEITTANDTRCAASALMAAGADILLFAGGDGTARDILDVVGDRLPLVGIPAGVKMHSAVFALNPEAAGETVAVMARQPSGSPVRLRLAEIMDADEAQRARGNPSLRLFGHACVPDLPRFLQPAKGARIGGGEAAIAALGRKLVAELSGRSLVVIGPGTTMQMVKHAFGFEGSLLGVDVLLDGANIRRDVDAAELEQLARQSDDITVITGVIGHQGFVFGRGNQQISAELLRACRRENLIVVATREKLAALPQGVLHLDSGDPEVDRGLSGYIKVRTGPVDSLVMRLEAFL